MAKRDILYTMICDGAKQLMDRKILNKIKASDNQPEFVQLTNARERYKKMTNF